MNLVTPIRQYKGRILIAEDEGIIAVELKLILQKNGYKISGLVRTGEAVLDYISNSEPPDLILMDIMLKGSLNGIETAVRVKQQSDIPIIFLTSLSDDETYLLAHKTKPYTFINKPYFEEKLISSIENALNSGRNDI